MLINYMCVICNIIYVIKIYINIFVILNIVLWFICIVILLLYCIFVINIDIKNIVGNVVNILLNFF